MTERIERPGSAGKIRRPIRVMIRDEDLDAIAGQGVRGSWIAPEGDDADGQIYVLTVPHAGDKPDDVEGQGSRAGWLEPADDAEGQGYRYNLRPAGEDEVAGQGYRGNYLVPDETDPSGNVWRLEAPEGVEGQGASYGRLRPTGDDDTEGQGKGTRPPVD